MARALHDTDALLDAVRDLVLERGPRGVGIRDVAARSGAPSGSLYHRFASRDEMVALAWLRAVRRFQDGFVPALRIADPIEAVRGAVDWAVRFAHEHPADTRLLLGAGQRDLLDAAPGPALAERLAESNLELEREVRRLAIRAFGRDDAAARERMTHAVVDLPLAALRRHLQAGTLTARAGELVAAACVALVTDPQEHSS